MGPWKMFLGPPVLPSVKMPSKILAPTWARLHRLTKFRPRRRHRLAVTPHLLATHHLLATGGPEGLCPLRVFLLFLFR
jgi:hypothetical protein